MEEYELQQQIMKDEGFSLTCYRDTEGIPTVGWGHTGKDLVVGKRYTMEQCRLWFASDYDTAINDYNSLGFTLDKVRRAVLIMMLFNLGKPRFLTFKKMLGYLQAKEYIMAMYEGLDSKWRKQVKNRAHRTMAALGTGVWV